MAPLIHFSPFTTKVRATGAERGMNENVMAEVMTTKTTNVCSAIKGAWLLNMKWASSGFDVRAIVGGASYQSYRDVPNVVARRRHDPASRPF
jgi:hypothetical protein